MKIKTLRPVENPNRKNGPSSARSRRAHRRAPQKLGNARTTVQWILSICTLLWRYSGIILISVSVLYLTLYIRNSDKFHLEDIAIYGCQELDSRKLERLVRQNVPEDILRIDLASLKTLLEKEKWVKEVKIRRILPSGLAIAVRERVPAVVLEMQGGLMIADDEGILLDTYNSKYGKLDVPVFKGVIGKDEASYRLYQEENTARIRHALDMLSEIASGSPQYTRRISEIDISDRNNLKIMLVDNTAEIFLGKEDYLNRFRTLINSDKYQEFKNQNLNFTEIDLRFDDKIIFRGNSNVSESPEKRGK
jgi:cell division septal protein FtsQ